MQHLAIFLTRTVSVPEFLRAASILVLPALLGCSPASVPTVEEADAFLAEAEADYLEASIENQRASWVQATYITQDTQKIAAAASEKLMIVTADAAKQAASYRDLDLSEDSKRKIDKLRVALTLPAPSAPGAAGELAGIESTLKGMYGSGAWCPEGGECTELEALVRTMAVSRDANELRDAWAGWRTISPQMRGPYARLAELANEGSRELGFADTGAMWRSGYDMAPDEFSSELDRLWQQVKPLYDSLHCYTRDALGDFYGEDVVPQDEPIPAHLLGNMWAQEWNNIYDILAPPGGDEGPDLDRLLVEKGYDEIAMVRSAERFFTSLGFEPLPETFWERSLFLKPEDRAVVCHASAWNIDAEDDLRIKMCIEVTGEMFRTIHHELGHNFYQRAYNVQDPLFRGSANGGFHEAVGDVLSLSVTPSYLVEIGLLESEPDATADLGLLMRRALDKVAFLPFALMIDQWRWGVFSGEIPEDRYNAAWWELRESLQGVRAPVDRSEADFDPGAKYHVPGNTSYERYFVADILQFQLHRDLCAAAGWEGPLHRCSIYGNEEAGRRLREMLTMGSSRPWPEALAVIGGSGEMDATAMLDYFAPLQLWLDEQNDGRTCGW